MDFSLIVAVLSLLISSVSEYRNWAKDQKEAKVSPMGIGLIRLISILDDIINTGNKIGDLTDALASMDGRGEVLPQEKKMEMFDLITQQAHNIRDFSEACDAPLHSVSSISKVSLNDAINLMVPDKLETVGKGKSSYLKAVTWKLLQGESELGRLSLAGRCALLSLKKSTTTDKTPLGLIVHIPTKVTIQERYEKDMTWCDLIDEQITTYNLDSPDDIKKLVNDSHKHFANIKKLRDKLAEVTKEKFLLP